MKRLVIAMNLTVEELKAKPTEVRMAEMLYKEYDQFKKDQTLLRDFDRQDPATALFVELLQLLLALRLRLLRNQERNQKS